MMMRFVVASVVGALLIACSRQVPADYFPFKPGSQRLMRVFTRMIAGAETTETTEVRVVEIVRGEEDLPGMGRCWVVETPRDSGPPTYSCFRKTDDGVVQVVPAGSGKPPMEMLYLALPLTKGLKWHDTKDQREMMEVVSRDTVRVEAGTFPDCFEVVTTSTRADWTMRQWLGPDVGPVKWENRCAWTGKDGIRRDLLRRAELVKLQVPTAKSGRMP